MYDGTPALNGYGQSERMDVIGCAGVCCGVKGRGWMGVRDAPGLGDPPRRSRSVGARVCVDREGNPHAIRSYEHASRSAPGLGDVAHRAEASLGGLDVLALQCQARKLVPHGLRFSSQLQPEFRFHMQGLGLVAGWLFTRETVTHRFTLLYVVLAPHVPPHALTARAWP